MLHQPNRSLVMLEFLPSSCQATPSIPEELPFLWEAEPENAAGIHVDQRGMLASDKRKAT